jgi:ABC-type lipoprotein export system ATPase subunit
VLRDIDLELVAGEIIAVTGPNGAGKSTFLRHLNGLLRPTSGSVLVHGEDIAARPVGEVAASVGLLFQNPRHQLFERTAAREVRFGLDRRFGASEAAARTGAALAAVGLSAAADEHPAELPASRQRLLALATVLARKPAVLALDEPTVALDGRRASAAGRCGEERSRGGRRRRPGHSRRGLRAFGGRPMVDARRRAACSALSPGRGEGGGTAYGTTHRGLRPENRTEPLMLRLILLGAGL